MDGGFPRLYAAASLKRRRVARDRRLDPDGFPRLYAAASLKLLLARLGRLAQRRGFPRLYAAASLKRCRPPIGPPGIVPVFRGFMPRPH